MPVDRNGNWWKELLSLSDVCLPRLLVFDYGHLSHYWSFLDEVHLSGDYPGIVLEDQSFQTPSTHELTEQDISTRI